MWSAARAGNLPHKRRGKFTSKKTREINPIKSAGNDGHVSKITLSLSQLIFR